MGKIAESVQERQKALDRRFPTWEPRTLHQTFDAAAAEFPDRDFLVTDNKIYSYREMQGWSERLAEGLRSQGARAGDHIALVLANFPEFAALKLAISRIGCVAVPVNFLNRRDELAYVLEQSDANYLITMDQFRGLNYLQMLDELEPDWKKRGGGSRFPKLKRIFVFSTSDERPEDDLCSFNQLESDNGEGIPPADVSPDSVCDIIYTSGTTGGPKGVLLTHDKLLRTAYGSAYARAFEDGRRILFSMPMYHVYGYVEGLLSVSFVGGAIIPQVQFSPESTLKAIDRHRATDILLIPTMTVALMDAMTQENYSLESLTSMLSSGGKSPPGIWERIINCFGDIEITTGYGMTEATASSTVTRPDDPVEKLETTNGRMRFVGSAGDPALGGKLIQYRVVDPATERELPLGEMGELRMKGLGVTEGYYKKPRETKEAFDEKGWMKTGDLGVILPDDYLKLMGRTKESYRCGGEQVLPLEVEEVLVRHPSVLQAHVVPVPDDKMGEVGAAFIIPSDETTASAEELIALCAEKLARFKVPKHVFFIREDELPTTPTGRPRKFLLTERARKELAL